ncbi:hypothetical protein JTE90_012623 [Oedothorax gibbosus]|uniref:Palmitoyltransferase n=1 Tax=Oedothorax gibbosus TaxID=931172 RepID=A0AAV6UJP6_9ARAC|nr:hypothetical protein JTE90_012623 [Oedothorax gibbosus]
MVAEHLSSAWFEAEWKELDCKYEKNSSPVAVSKVKLKCRTVFDVVRTGTVDAVKFLVDKYTSQILCEKDENGHTAAHWACLGGHLSLVQYMLDLGVSVNIPSSSHIGAYPIHWACVEGHVSIVDLLLRSGVPLDICDTNGCTPLITACQHGNSHLVCFLLGRGANKTICDRNGDTALHWTSYKGFPDLMRLLIYTGFDPRLQDNFGYTSLHLACLSGNLVAVEDLCEKDKIELDIKDKQNRTALQLAEEQGQDDVADYLKQEIRKRKLIFSQFTIWNLVFGTNGHSKGPLFFFLGTLFFWGYPMYILRCVPLTWNEYELVHFVFLLTNGVMWVSLLIAHNLDPGYLALDTEDYQRTISELARFDKQHHKPMPQLCHTCRTVRPLRAKHCRVCNRCVRHFDHHCPYIYNCVGLNNRIWFLVFSLTIALNCTVTVFFAAACIWEEGWQYTYIIGLLEALLFCGIGWVLSGSTVLYAAYNLTMNEAFNYHRYRYLKDSDGHYHNPFNRGVFENVKEFFHCTRVWDVHDILKVEETV